MDARNIGCCGDGCERKERCSRYIERDCEERPITFTRAPYNFYEGQGKPCGYYEQATEED